MKIIVPVVAALTIASLVVLSASAQTPLAEGWNLVGATQEGIEEFVASRNEASPCEVKAVWRFEDDQTWSAWFSNAPELDEIGQLGGQSGYWVYCG